VILLLETGLRVNKEALPLKWADLDFVYDNIGAVHVRESKTPAGRRSVPLSPFCKRELLNWKGLFGIEFSPYVFPNPRNSLTFLKDIHNAWKSVIKGAALEGIWL